MIKLVLKSKPKKKASKNLYQLVVITDYWSAFDSLHRTKLRYGGRFPVRFNLTYFVRFTLYETFLYCNNHHLHRIFEVSFRN